MNGVREMSGILVFVVIIVGIAVLFNIAREVAKLVLTLFLSGVILLAVFHWTTQDYLDLFSLDKVISVEGHPQFYGHLKTWDEWRMENGLLLFR